MKLVIGSTPTEKDDILDVLYQYRMQGSTRALIDTMIINKDAIMVVHNVVVAKQLSRDYNIDITRFVLIGNLPNALIGRRGPLLFDIPAIIELALI